MADVLFINTTDKLEIKNEVNGTLILATKLLEAGIDVEVLRFCEIESYNGNDNYLGFIRDITERIIKIGPKCISFYTLWPYYHIMLRIAREIKAVAPQIITVMGGPQSSATASQTLSTQNYVDYICTGEGENTVVPFFGALLNGDYEKLAEIPSLYYRKDGKVVYNDLYAPLCDLNTLPYWDDRLYLKNHAEKESDISSYNYFMPIDAGRGCPYSCTFCCSSNFWRRTYRLKSPERIIQDIEYYNKKFGIRSFWFTHDAFTVNKKLVENVCEEILQRGLDIRWKCTTRINCISEDLVLKMKESGCTNIELGIETGSERMQKIIDKRLDLKKAHETIKFLLKNNIAVHTFFMHGFPEETESDINDTLELLFSFLDLGVQYASMNYCRFNPNTTMTMQYMDQLVLDPSIAILSRRIFGYEEELDVIKNNREIFPFFYHLNTPERNEYQYLRYFVRMYQQFPISMRYLRALYKGDNLKFYHDFIKNNDHIISKGADDLIEAVHTKTLEVAVNTMKDFDMPYVQQLKELMRYDLDRKQISDLENGTVVCKTYGFSIMDYTSKKPIDKYCSAESKLLMQKSGDKIKVKIMDIKEV